MNDVRDKVKVKSLPEDLRAVANKMLEDKFKLPSRGEMVEMKRPGNDYGDRINPLKSAYTTFIDAYMAAKRRGIQPDVIFFHPMFYQELMSDNYFRERIRGYIQADRVMGMQIKTDSRLSPDRIVVASEYRQEILFDNKSDFDNYGRPLKMYV